MTQTELQLVAVFKGPTVPLEEICERYLGMGWHTARAEAALNRLPFPTFRLTESRKAPIMVKVKDLADHIDWRAQEAAANWSNSQP